MTVRSNPRESNEHGRTCYPGDIKTVDSDKSFEMAREEYVALSQAHLSGNTSKGGPRVESNHGGMARAYHLEPHNPETSLALAQKQLGLSGRTKSVYPQ